MHVRSRLALVALVALSHLSCGPKSPPAGSGSGGGVVAHAGGGALVADADTPDGLVMRLGEGRELVFAAGGPLAAVARPGKGAPLSRKDAETLLARLQPIKSDAGDTVDFALRDRSQPAPRPGKTVATPFPPPAGAGKPPTAGGTPGQLTVLRYAPEGDVPLAPHLSVTFSLPMVAITSHADSVAGGVPVTLTPQPKGQWRWVGTQTLLFDPEVRFPQATSFEVRIPAGTRAATGEQLAQAVSFRFATPAPRLLASYPTGGPQRRDPLLFARFDQRIDPAAVLATIAVTAGGTKYRLHLASDAEVAADKAVAELVAAARSDEQDGRWLAFALDQALPTDTQVAVPVGPGTPSREGPRTTAEPQSWSFRTYGPFKVVGARCWATDCPPGEPWHVELSNPIDEDAFDGSLIRVAPTVGKIKSWVGGNWLTVQTRGKSRTTYTVTVPASLRDRFGQTLGKDEELTFKVGSPWPQLSGPQGLVVLDPAASKPTLDVFTGTFTELHVQAWRVDPEKDWPAFVQWMQDYYRGPAHPPGTSVVDTTIKINGPADALTETPIDLTAALGGRIGHAVVLVTPRPWTRQGEPPTLRAWVQSTAIGLDAFVDNGELYGWASRLSDGAPLSGVSLKIAPFGVAAASDASGLARLPLPAKNQKGPHVLYAHRGKDVAFLPENLYYWDDGWGGWVRHDDGQALRWYVFDDRHMYRPGEDVHLKGWMRRVELGKGGDVAALAGAVDQISWVLYGPRNNKLADGKTAVNAAGGFDLALSLPKTPNLGSARIELTAVGKGKLGGRAYSHYFQIQEFRRPEYEVTARVSPGPHLVGGTAIATVKAAYFAGGGLGNADVAWDVTASAGSFTPPNRDDYVFGQFVPWWRWDDGSWAEPTYQHYQGKTDATGEHALKIDLVSMKPPRPMQVTAQASVTDVNRQQWGATAMFLVHPADLYVGLKTPVPFVDAGKPVDVDAIVVDLDGKAVPGIPVTLRAVRKDWKIEKGQWKEVEEDPQECTLTSGQDATRCSFKTSEGGRIEMTAVIHDRAGRANQTELSVWVAGGQLPPERNVTQQEVVLIPSQKEYRAGDTARLLVQAPFYPAEGLLSLRRSGIVSTTRFKVTGPSTTLTIPIVDGYTPDLWAQVDLIGSAERVGDDGKPTAKLPRRPALASGAVMLSVPPRQRTLAVDVEPRDRKLEPGGKTSLNIQVRDAGGQPVAGAELAVVVVDEAVLALSGYQLADPVAAFYPQREAGVRDYHQRPYVTLARPDVDTLGGGDKDADGVVDDVDKLDLKSADDDGDTGGAMPPPPPAEPAPEAARAPGHAAGRGNAGPAGAPIAVRSNFDPLAVFAPAVATDAAGKATVEVVLPDNLTRYRVMVVAVADARQFGKGESAITARMPLMVRPSAPRFLNYGDRFELPVVLQNQTDRPMTVKVAARGSNLALTGDIGYALQVPANDRLEVRFDAAAEMPGTARLQIAAAAGNWADAAEVALPVWTPATTEAFATYGVIDAGAIRQPVALPGKVAPRFGGLEITTSSTQLQALTDAFLYLVAYPYECSEQLSSRVLAVAALRDVMTAFKAEGLPPPAQIDAAVKRDIERLASMQNGDGGFGFWRRGDESWPFTSINVAHAMARAKAKGYTVPESMMKRSLGYLRDIRRRTPVWYPEEVKRTIEAYALYARTLAGDPDPARARSLLTEGRGIGDRSLEAVGWLYYVMAGDAGSADALKIVRRHLANRATEEAGTAHFVTSYGDGAYLLLHSDRRVDGIVLEALIADQPKNDLIPKLVRGLLDHRTAGRWENTQENAFVLLALDRYFNEYEKATPSFVARAWLGDGLAAEHTFKGRSTDYQQVDVPMAWLAAHPDRDLTLSKTGTGRLYYRVGMTYAPADLVLDPSDHGFAVQRSYQAVDRPDDVVHQKDGSWKIRAGARVRVQLTMVAQSRRYHVALVDPMPAGLEAMNPALAVTGNIPRDPAAQKRDPYWWWSATWYEHQNMRDERVEAFASLLWEGVHEYSYVARATTPGSFVVPPTKAEEMYHPETFGRSGTDRVIVE